MVTEGLPAHWLRALTMSADDDPSVNLSSSDFSFFFGSLNPNPSSQNSNVATAAGTAAGTLGTSVDGPATGSGTDQTLMACGSLILPDSDPLALYGSTSNTAATFDDLFNIDHLGPLQTTNPNNLVSERPCAPSINDPLNSQKCQSSQTDPNYPQQRITHHCQEHPTPFQASYGGIQTSVPVALAHKTGKIANFHFEDHSVKVEVAVPNLTKKSQDSKINFKTSSVVKQKRKAPAMKSNPINTSAPSGRAFKMPSDDFMLDQLDDLEKIAFQKLCSKSTKWTKHELLVYVTTMKMTFGNNIEDTDPTTEMLAFERIIKLLLDDPLSTKKRCDILTYRSNWKRRYRPILLWLKDGGSEKPRKPTIDSKSGRSGKTAGASRSHASKQKINTLWKMISTMHNQNIRIKPLATPTGLGMGLKLRTPMDLTRAVGYSDSISDTYQEGRVLREHTVNNEVRRVCESLQKNEHGDENITSVDFSHTYLSSQAIQLIGTCLEKNQYLRQLHLPAFQYRDNVVTHFFECLSHNRSLSALSIKGHVSLHTINMLIDLLRKSPGLTWIDLEWGDVDGKDLAAINDLLEPNARGRLWKTVHGEIPHYALVQLELRREMMQTSKFIKKQ